MRIYKFRGFHPDENGKTVIKLNGKEIKGTWFYGDLHTDGPYINEHKVIPETVGQYTGLDDIRGKEIFEGDIFKTKEYGKEVQGKNYSGYDYFSVRYVYGSFVILNKTRVFYLLHRDKKEVIGSIYETPELWEVEE